MSLETGLKKWEDKIREKGGRNESAAEKTI
jgi:hypothetical protein